MSVKYATVCVVAAALVGVIMYALSASAQSETSDSATSVPTFEGVAGVPVVEAPADLRSALTLAGVPDGAPVHQSAEGDYVVATVEAAGTRWLSIYDSRTGRASTVRTEGAKQLADQGGSWVVAGGPESGQSMALLVPDKVAQVNVSFDDGRRTTITPEGNLAFIRSQIGFDASYTFGGATRRAEARVSESLRRP